MVSVAQAVCFSHLSALIFFGVLRLLLLSIEHFDGLGLTFLIRKTYGHLFCFIVVPLVLGANFSLFSFIFGPFYAAELQKWGRFYVGVAIVFTLFFFVRNVLLTYSAGRLLTRAEQTAKCLIETDGTLSDAEVYAAGGRRQYGRAVVVVVSYPQSASVADEQLKSLEKTLLQALIDQHPGWRFSIQFKMQTPRS